jgi:hypothetical protein
MGNRRAATLLVLLGLALALLGPAPAALADPCPACHGTGRCPSCGGAGFIPAGMAHGQPAAYGCEACGGRRGNPFSGPPGGPGTGRCRNCNGTGQVPGNHPADRPPQPPPGPSPEELARQKAHAEANALNETGVQHFKARRWREAIAAFEAALVKWRDNKTIEKNLQNARKALTGAELHQAADSASSEIRRAIADQQIHDIEQLQRELLEREKSQQEAWRQQLAEEARQRAEFLAARQAALERMSTGDGDAPAARFAWEKQITNPQIAKLMRGLRAIEVPPPLPHEQVAMSWHKISAEYGAQALDHGSDVGFLLWDLCGKLGQEAPLLHCKVVLIVGKVFIAGEDGAYVHLVKQDAAVEEALGYLKQPVASRMFAEVVRDLKETGEPPESADPNMVRAARAILDPALGNSSTRMAWDAMLSPEATAAMVRKACLEVGGELLSQGTEGMLHDLTRHEGIYDAARLERREAQKLLKHAGDALERDQLKKVIRHADYLLQSTYRLERAGPHLAGFGIEKLAERAAEEGGTLLSARLHGEENDEDDH